MLNSPPAAKYADKAVTSILYSDYSIWIAQTVLVIAPKLTCGSLKLIKFRQCRLAEHKGGTTDRG